MPTQWLFLHGAPSVKEVTDAAKRSSSKRSRVVDSPPPTQLSRWRVIETKADIDADTRITKDNDISKTTTAPLLRTFADIHDAYSQLSPSQVGSSILLSDSQILQMTEDAAVIQAVLLDKSRALADESQLRRHASRTSMNLLANNTSDASEETESQILPLQAESQDSYYDSLLPPPTQQRSRLLGDTSRLKRDSLGNITEERSLMNLPSWSFSLSTITQLNMLPSAQGSSRYNNSPRVNLLVYIHELELPATMPIKNTAYARKGRAEVTRAGLNVVDESGASLKIVLWDEYAEEWAGKHLAERDVIYLEKIALSEYKGQRQGSTVDGSKVQVCYRTATRHAGKVTDKVLQPDLDLAWDQISQKVKTLVQLAKEL